MSADALRSPRSRSTAVAAIVTAAALVDAHPAAAAASVAAAVAATVAALVAERDAVDVAAAVDTVPTSSAWAARASPCIACVLYSCSVYFVVMCLLLVSAF